MKKLSLTIITMAVCLTVNGQQIGQQRSRWDRHPDLRFATIIVPVPMILGEVNRVEADLTEAEQRVALVAIGKRI